MTGQADAVTVAYVHANKVAYSWHHSFFQLWNTDLAAEHRIRRGGLLGMRCNSSAFLPDARNKAVARFLAEAKAPWLLWLDTDMGFQPDLLEQLLHAADPAERPVVGALCFSQREIAQDGMGGWHTLATPTIFDWREDGGLQGFEMRLDYPPNTLVRCAGTGSAAVLIHRGAFQRVAAEYGPHWYDRLQAKEGSVGEDLSFCMRLGAAGVPVHVHTGVRTTHFKQTWLSETDFLTHSAVPPATQEVAVLVPVLRRPGHAEPFMASLRASTGLAKVWAVVGPDDEQAEKAWCAAGANVLSTSLHTFAEKVNFAYKASAHFGSWLLLVGSDVRFHAGWLDHALAMAGDRYHVVGTNDLGNPRVMAGEHAVHPLVRRSYVDEQGASWDGPGVLAHEGYRHWFVDDEIVTAAKQRGVWVAALASKVEHLHPMWNRGQPDEVYDLGQSFAEQDRVLFQRRLAEHGG